MRTLFRARRQSGGVLTGVLILIVLAVIAAAAWFGFDYLRFRDAPLAVRAPNQTVEIAKGENFRDIVHDLRAARLSHATPLYWRVLAEQLKVTGKLHAGEYALPFGITARRLLQDMAAGRVLQRKVTLVEGWTFQQVRALLAAAPKLAQPGARFTNEELMTRIGSKAQKPEGEFMPDTYDYVLGMSDLDILARAHAALQEYLAAQWPGRDPSIPLQTSYQALVLASIVEKETAQPQERPEIAGVFERRLKIGMKLETDPSVIYGMGAAYNGNIRKGDLETDTPYNTYIHAGLPPTPIALPGRAAIDAVLHPAPGDALYFVARGDGSHIFAATLEEHNRNVALYQLHREPAANPPPMHPVKKSTEAKRGSGKRRRHKSGHHGSARQ